MSEPFVAEIRIFPYNFAPRNWAFCDGQLMPISQNTALFSLVGTTYGGDGRTTFALPNLQGRVPMHPGHGPGLSDRRLGESGGAETVTLTQQGLAPHSHALLATSNPADLSTPAAGRSLARSAGGFAYQDTTGNLANMSSDTLTNIGGNQAHNNLMPIGVLHFCIALFGIYPSRS